MCFFNIKNFNNDKKFYLYDKFFVSNQIFLTCIQKLFKIPGFSGFLVVFVQNSRFFSLNCQIQGFSRLTG